jgi:hypothetical protein
MSDAATSSSIDLVAPQKVGVKGADREYDRLKSYMQRICGTDCVTKYSTGSTVMIRIFGHDQLFWHCATNDAAGGVCQLLDAFQIPTRRHDGYARRQTGRQYP